MNKYSVYRKDDLREKCECGFCHDSRGFKNNIKLWHAPRQLFTDSIENALEYVEGQSNLIIYYANYEYLNQVEDLKPYTGA